MLYRGKDGKDWVIRLTIGTALAIAKDWNINLLERKTAKLTEEEAVKIANTATGYDRGFFDSVADDLIPYVEAELLYFYFPPDYEKPSDEKKKDGDGQKITFALLYELGGSAGLDPSPLTLWQLLAAVKGSQKRDWATTSATLSLLYNVNRGRKNKAKTPADFNPTIEKKAKPLPCIDNYLRGK